MTDVDPELDSVDSLDALDPDGEAAAVGPQAAAGGAAGERGPRTAPEEQDFRAALFEIDSNLSVRRLMFVLSNVLVPACLMALADCMTGASYPAELRFLPEHILPIVGVVLAVAGVLVTAILARCHFGLVVNGHKLRRVQSGTFLARGLNWLGVTTNFTALTALSAGGGLALAVAGVGYPIVALFAGPALIALLMVNLRVNHWRANRLSRRLSGSWEPRPVSRALREKHARMSLDATTSDVAVVVTMAAALFAGAFNCMTNLGGIAPDLEMALGTDTVRRYGVTAVGAFTLVSLLLSGRMVVRLRIALGQHSAALAGLRNEPDDAFAFRPYERTYLLFALLHLLASVTAAIVAWGLLGQGAGILSGAGLMLCGLGWYPVRLRLARR